METEVMQEEQKDQILQLEAKNYYQSLSGVRSMILLNKLLNELPGNFKNSKREDCVLCIVKNNDQWIVSYVTDNNGVQYTYLKKDLLEALICMGIKKGILKYE